MSRKTAVRTTRCRFLQAELPFPWFWMQVLSLFNSAHLHFIYFLVHFFKFFWSPKQEGRRLQCFRQQNKLQNSIAGEEEQTEKVCEKERRRQESWSQTMTFFNTSSTPNGWSCHHHKQVLHWVEVAVETFRFPAGGTVWRILKKNIKDSSAISIWADVCYISPLWRSTKWSCNKLPPPECCVVTINIHSQINAVMMPQDVHLFIIVQKSHSM